LAARYGGEPLSIQVRKRSTSSAGQGPRTGTGTWSRARAPRPRRACRSASRGARSRTAPLGPVARSDQRAVL